MEKMKKIQIIQCQIRVNTKEVNFIMERGIFFFLQFALLSNSKLINIVEGEKILVPIREEVEIDENGYFYPS